jgi:ATP/maltotriose-dependent transcriptional regulator MalT
MTSDPLVNASTSIIAQIQAHQAAGEWETAANLLADHAGDLLDRLTAAELAAIFAPFPKPVITQLPALWFVASVIHARLHAVEEAFAWLTQAADYFTRQELRPDRAIWVHLELARLYYSRDEFAYVRQHIEAAEALMRQHDALLPAHAAFLNYMIASLCGDTGRVAEGMGYAQRAAQQYHLQGNLARAFRAWLTVCSFAQQVGSYPLALDALSRARVCYETGRLESAAFEALLNAVTHLAWYRGHLEEARSLAQTWVRFSQGSGFHRQRLYAHWMMGNILRALGDYPQAQHYYTLTRQIVAVHSPNFSRWIDAQESWLAVLQGDYPTAERLIRQALVSADPGQTMSFQVNLGVIELLTGRWGAAESHLRESLAFYARSQDRQATCAIAFHLAYLQIEQGVRTPVLLRPLRAALKWLEGEDNAYFPLWWHAPIVSRVAALLLTVPEFHALGRRFFRQPFLGEAGVHMLRQLYLHAKPVQRAELAEMLGGHAAAPPAASDLHSDAGRVIASAVEDRLLEPAMLAGLFQQLRTAQQRDRDNPTIVAIFLLHIQGISTGDIALRLDMSRSSVSHALQIIYESLGIPRDAGSRIEQRQALHQAAREQGLIV